MAPAPLKTAGIDTATGLRLKIGMTQADIDKARTAWQLKLKGAIMGVGRQAAEHTNLEMAACVTALEILDRIEPVAEEVKKAQIEAGAAKPRFIDQGGTEVRPKAGPFALPQAGGPAAPAATLPPPAKPQA